MKSQMNNVVRNFSEMIFKLAVEVANKIIYRCAEVNLMKIPCIVSMKCAAVMLLSTMAEFNLKMHIGISRVRTVMSDGKNIFHLQLL